MVLLKAWSVTEVTQRANTLILRTQSYKYIQINLFSFHLLQRHISYNLIEREKFGIFKEDFRLIVLNS